MSHVAKINVEIKNLDALRAAAERLGLEMDLTARKYHWYGRHVGDYPLPTGFTREDMGKADVGVLRIPGNEGAYEIGICKRRDGGEGFELLWDFYGGGFGLQAHIGDGGHKLTQMYAVEAAKAAARRTGRWVTETAQADGSIQLKIRV